MSWIDDPENAGNVPLELEGMYDLYGRYKNSQPHQALTLLSTLKGAGFRHSKLDRLYSEISNLASRQLSEVESACLQQLLSEVNDLELRLEN